jgi:hypothetical protein
MTDRRELVLQRLLAILATLQTVQHVVRNRGELPPGKRPAIVLLDADEVARAFVPQQRGRLIAYPSLVDMTPEIYVVMDLREPDNTLIGEDMDALRIAIIKAITADQELHGILSANGDIRYVGCETDMASGRTMEGQLHIKMTFTYPLIPSEL